MITSNFKTFETERLLLKPVLVEDAPFIYELMNTQGWLDFIGDRNIKTIADAEKYIQEKMLPQLYELGFGNYIVVRKTDQQKLGTCGIYNRAGLEGVDIGFAFLPEYMGKGYACESAMCLRDVAIEEFSIKKLSAITSKLNIKSQRLLERLDLVFKEFIQLPNDDEELMLFELPDSYFKS